MSGRRSISNTFTVIAMDDPVPGQRGKTGRFYYYAQKWTNSSSPLYIVTDAQAPYFLYNNNYWVFNPEENYPDGISMSAMGTPSSSDSKWQLMTNDFKYIITQAIFGKYAQFGSFVINGDWLICTNGTINGTAYNTTDINNPSMYNGAAAYTWFDPSYPWSSVNAAHSVDGKQWSGYNFVPNFAVNGLTGDTYQNNAHIKGHIEATSGDIGGFTIDTDRLYNSNWEAGIDINYDSKVLKMGKNAAGEVDSEDAIIRAENKKTKSQTTDTYNTAMYLNASGALYNYAFYGKGNGVLDGYVQGFKVYAITNLAGTESNPYQVNLRNGMVQAIVSQYSGADKYLRLPTLGEIRQTLGINAYDTTNFTCQLVLINQSAIQGASFNIDNVWVKGSSHDYNTQITSLTAIPRILRATSIQEVGLSNATMLIFHITYINKRFIANYILG